MCSPRQCQNYKFLSNLLTLWTRILFRTDIFFSPPFRSVVRPVVCCQFGFESEHGNQISSLSLSLFTMPHAQQQLATRFQQRTN